MRTRSNAFDDLSPFAKTFADHLSKFVAAPILFVGSGVSRRYLESPDWRTLLSQLADLTTRDYSYYRSTASDVPPMVAELMVEPLKERLWQPQEEPLRKKYEKHLLHPSSALKIYVTEILNSSTDVLQVEPRLAQEIQLLRNAKIDAVITTNYDNFMERMFEDYKVFVGQMN